MALNPQRPGSSPDVDREIARRTRRSFLGAAAATAAGLAGFGWLATRPDEDERPGPLRRVYEFNESLTEKYFNDAHLAKTYPVSMSRMPKVNEEIGMDDDDDLKDWHLELQTGNGAHTISLAEIQALPPIEMVTELKCVEGWSQIVHWKGARISDFLDKYAPEERRSGHNISLQTPDEEYYVGLDMQSALHPQSLLCYEMQGEPLAKAHGAPLRLATPLKYGIKNIKRIGKMSFHAERPADYWAERGYDWYSGM